MLIGLFNRFGFLCLSLFLFLRKNSRTHLFYRQSDYQFDIWLQWKDLELPRQWNFLCLTNALLKKKNKLGQAVDLSWCRIWIEWEYLERISMRTKYDLRFEVMQTKFFFNHWSSRKSKLFENRPWDIRWTKYDC